MNVEDNWYFLRVIESLIVIIEHPVMRMFCLVFFQIFLFFSARPLIVLVSQKQGDGICFLILVALSNMT